MHGWGPYSEVVTVVTTYTPEKMSVPTVQIENIYAKISWTAPDSRGAAVTAYRVLITTHSGMQFLESDNCESSDPLLLTNLYCYVPMEELTSEKYALEYNELIIARVQAQNPRGWGEISDPNTDGALAEVIPKQVQNLLNGPLTTETEIDLYWTELTTQEEIGGVTCTILSYNVDWDEGLGGEDNWSEITGITQLLTLSNYLHTVDV